MERYAIRNRLKTICTCADSGIKLYTTALVTDNMNGNLHLQAKFKNVSKKEVQSMEINIQAFNYQKQALRGIDSFVYENISAKQGTFFADRIPIILPEPSTYFVIVNLMRVTFTDGQVWENIGYIPFRKIPWYKRYLPGLISLGIVVVMLIAGVSVHVASKIYGSSFSSIPFHILNQKLSANEVVEKMGNDYTTMSDGTQYYLDYGTYDLDGKKGNLELYFDENQYLSQMVWDMGYAPDTSFDQKDLSKMATSLSEEFNTKYKLDDSNKKDITYTWDVKGIKYKLEFQKTSRGNDVTITSVGDGKRKL